MGLSPIRQTNLKFKIMKADAIRLAIRDFNDAVKEDDTTSAVIFLTNDATMDIGPEAKLECPWDINVLIVKDDEVTCYIDCDTINSITIQ